MNKRKVEVGEVYGASLQKQQCIAKDVLESEKVLRELSMLFPEDKFLSRVPRVVMKHMVYSRIPNRTLVDKQIVNIPTVLSGIIILVAYISRMN